MRYLMLMIASGIAVATIGCESAAPRQLAEQGEAAPEPPAPEAPPPEKTAEEKAAEAAGGVQQLRRQSLREATTTRMEKEGRKAPADGEQAAAAGTPKGAPDAPDDDQELKKAEAGVGVKGKDYGGEGFVTTPIQQYFRIQERIAFEAQIPNAMKLYKAAHDNKGPATHEEFMDVIIHENGVPLPELKPGEKYWYNAETEELMVRSPNTD